MEYDIYILSIQGFRNIFPTPAIGIKHGVCQKWTVDSLT